MEFIRSSFIGEDELRAYQSVLRYLHWADKDEIGVNRDDIISALSGHGKKLREILGAGLTRSAQPSVLFFALFHPFSSLDPYK
jgi:hypothetical protein